MHNPTSKETSIVLYDAALGGTPDTQGKLIYRTSPESSATQSFASGRTRLDSTANQKDAAGYFANPKAIPALERTAGFKLLFTVQLIEERHSDSDKDGDGVGDRAGFSVIALSSDLRGIEVGFWPDQVWAQEDGSAEPPSGTLFTHAEHAPFDTTRLTAYTLVVQGDGYDLSANGHSVLTGRLRDYTTFEGPVNPYRTPNFIFLGDDSGSAQAKIQLAYVALSVSE